MVATRLRGEAWASLGLSRPENRGRTILAAIGATVVILAVSLFLQSVVVPALFGEARADTSRFDALRGNVVRLISMLWRSANVWDAPKLPRQWRSCAWSAKGCSTVPGIHKSDGIFMI